MVAVIKPNKIRICLDPRDLNEAIKREHYQMPTIEEVATRLNRAKLFTVLNAKDAFWQKRLDLSPAAKPRLTYLSGLPMATHALQHLFSPRSMAKDHT